MLPRRAFLGAELPADDEAFVDGGVRIAGVAPASMAERAGLAAGDLLVAIAGLPVRDLCELAEGLRRAGGETETELAFERGGRRIVARAAVAEQPVEDGVTYGELPVSGARLRTLTTRVDDPRALIIVLQGIACESVDLATAPEAPLAGLVDAWARAGIDSLRFDKRGVGDSTGGPCRALDFATELADATSAVDRAREIARARRIPLFAFGHSVGGIVAATLARELDGLIVYGAPAMSWLDCLRDSTRRQLALRGAPDSEIAQRVAGLDELLRAGELNGRSAAYHAQLAALDLEAAWRAVACPLLVVRGEHDWVVDAGDQARIATLAGSATVVDVPGLDHLFGRHADREASLRDYGIGAFDPALARATIEWLDRQRARV